MKQSSTLRTIGYSAGLLTSILGAYHGYKRNQSVGWAFGWFLFGGILWPFALPLMFASGFGKPRKGLNPVSGLRGVRARRRRDGRRSKASRTGRPFHGFEFDVARLLSSESARVLDRQREEAVKETVAAEQEAKERNKPGKKRRRRFGVGRQRYAAAR